MSSCIAHYCKVSHIKIFKQDVTPKHIYCSLLCIGGGGGMDGLFSSHDASGRGGAGQWSIKFIRHILLILGLI